MFFSISSLADSNKIVSVNDYPSLNQQLADNLSSALPNNAQFTLHDEPPGPIYCLECYSQEASFDDCYKAVIDQLCKAGYDVNNIEVFLSLSSSL